MKVLLLHRESHNVVAFVSVDALLSWLGGGSPSYTDDPATDQKLLDTIRSGGDYEGGVVFYEWITVLEDLS